MKNTVYRSALLILALILLIPSICAAIYAQQTSFVTQTIFNQPYFYVDNNTSDVDSVEDKGTHSNFPAQQSAPDSSFDMLNEELGEGRVFEDYVDTNTSDVDGSGGIGGHSSFPAQQSGPDGIYGTLLEENTAPSSNFTMLDDGFEDLIWDANWNTIPSNWIEDNFPVHSGFASATASDFNEGTFTSDSLDASGAAAIYVDFWFRKDDTDSYDFTLFYYDGTSYNLIDELDNNGFDDTWLHYTDKIVDSQYFVSNFRIRFDATLGFGENIWVDDVLIEKEEAGGSFELDLEVQFTEVVDFLATEELGIYTGALGSEDLKVDYWSGTGWNNLASDLAENTWNNYTISITSPIFTVRFSGGDETTDPTQDQWQIDSVVLRLQGSGRTEDVVDHDTSDVDGSSDLGTLSDFDNMKAMGGVASLTESLVGGTVWMWQEDTSSYTSTSSYETFQFWSSWTTESASSGTITKLGTYVFADPENSPQVKLGIYDDQGGSPNNLLGETNSAVINGVGWIDLDVVGNGVTVSESTTYHISHITNSVPTAQWRYSRTATPVSDYRNGRVWDIMFDPAGATTKSGSYRYGAYRVGFVEPTEYWLDSEVQWINVPNNLSNEELCIYAGSMGSEDLKVDVWNGNSWDNLFVDLTTGWNNASITDWLTSSNFTLRFRDGTEISDSIQDTWQIDMALLHLWNEDDSSKLDLEVQWTDADFSETNEELCIYLDSGASEVNNTHSLDTTGGYMLVGDGTPDWGSTTGSISFWAKFDTVANRPWGQHDNMEIRFSGTNLWLDWGTSDSLISATSFTADKWYFIAITWDEFTDDLILYVGDEDNPPTIDASNSAWFSLVSTTGVTQNNFMASKNGVNPVDGHGDDLRYWNTDRSLAEIQADYDNQVTGSELNLRSYFKLNNSFDDAGPDNNDGSGSGSYVFSTDVPFSTTTYENLAVDVWTGASWQNAISGLSNGWNNVSVNAYLTDMPFTIRFKDGSGTGDTTQDSWNIDSTLLHVWS